MISCGKDVATRRARRAGWVGVRCLLLTKIEPLQHTLLVEDRVALTRQHNHPRHVVKDVLHTMETDETFFIHIVLRRGVVLEL